MSTSFIFFILSVVILYIAYTIPKHHEPKQTKLIVYVHDYFTGSDMTAITVAGHRSNDGPLDYDIMKFGAVAIVDDIVTDGPSIGSNHIGRAQGTYINSQLDGKGLYLVFSLIFNDGEFKGSSLEIQGSDILTVEEREFGIVSGTGYFRFVQGYGLLRAESMDLANFRAVMKLNITVKHY